MRWLACLLLAAGCATPAPQPPPDPAIETLKKQLDEARNELLLAKAAFERERDALRAEVRAIEGAFDSWREARTQGTELRDLHRALKEANSWIAEYQKRFGDITPGPLTPSGKVRSVQGKIVAMDLGANDLVRVGDIYHIRRGATYVGQIRINKVGAKASSGVFDDESAGDGARRLGSLISFTRTMDEERSPRTQESPS